MLNNNIEKLMRMNKNREMISSLILMVKQRGWNNI
jgi:hypothetical protein